MIYDRLAGNYDKALAPFEKRFLSAWRRETLSHLPAAAEGSRVLEIGAGTGLNFPFYPSCRQQQQHGVATEISLKMLEFARTKTDSIRLVQADAENLPFSENAFDAAFATLVFCSIPNPRRAFAELRRVVRPNGKVVLLEHVRPDGLLGIVFDVLSVVTVALIEDHFDRRTARIAADCGLKVTAVKKKAFGIVNLIVCEVVK